MEALNLPPGMMLAMPAGSGQPAKMDLNELKEQLQKLVPGAHLTLTPHPQVDIDLWYSTSLSLLSCYKVSV